MVKKNWVEWKPMNKIDLDATSSFHQHSHLNLKPSSFNSWTKPLEVFVKINFNRSKSCSLATTDFIIISWDGRFLEVGTTTNPGASLVLAADAMTMQNSVHATI